MTDTPQTDAIVTWTGDVPVATRFDDPYYSLEDGLAETRHVFLDGNDLAARWSGAQTARVAELGFGTGLNFLAALELWRRVTGPRAHLSFTSFELFPMRRADMARALAPWSMLDSAELLDVWPEDGMPEAPLNIDGAQLEIVSGDANRTVSEWTGMTDAWFLDGFAPARNPELWRAELMQAVFDRTAPGGTFATYSAAGHIRRALAGAGFEVTRQPGFGGKRHMTTGIKPKLDSG